VKAKAIAVRKNDNIELTDGTMRRVLAVRGPLANGNMSLKVEACPWRLYVDAYAEVNITRPLDPLSVKV